MLFHHSFFIILLFSHFYFFLFHYQLKIFIFIYFMFILFLPNSSLNNENNLFFYFSISLKSSLENNKYNHNHKQIAQYKIVFFIIYINSRDWSWLKGCQSKIYGIFLILCVNTDVIKGNFLDISFSFPTISVTRITNVAFWVYG